MTASDLHTRAILVGARISAWSARKYDRKISQEVAETHGATIEAGRYNKHLMPADAATYKALNSHLANLRNIHYANTLPWTDDGWRILPAPNYEKYQDAMRKGFREAEALLDAFIDDYPLLRAEAQRRVNGLFNSTDYPSISEIRSRYSFGLEFLPIPAGSDYRVALSQDEIDMIASRTEERVKQAADAAQSDAVKRLYDVVSHIHERLTATTKGDDGEIKPGIFRDSLIDNARELCDVLQRLNLYEDPVLEQLRQRTEKISRTEPQTLRENSDVRVDTAKEAQSILAAFTATYGASIFAPSK
ncbi:MAG TPA: hypothetical protein VFW94_23525 [Candidatus Acidoferrales bacterium]|nr:hypothetical protein [Candidatus Acidoferrales bacterium]